MDSPVQKHEERSVKQNNKGKTSKITGAESNLAYDGGVQERTLKGSVVYVDKDKKKETADLANSAPELVERIGSAGAVGVFVLSKVLEEMCLESKDRAQMVEGQIETFIRAITPMVCLRLLKTEVFNSLASFDQPDKKLSIEEKPYREEYKAIKPYKSRTIILAPCSSKSECQSKLNQVKGAGNIANTMKDIAHSSRRRVDGMLRRELGHQFANKVEKMKVSELAMLQTDKGHFCLVFVVGDEIEGEDSISLRARYRYVFNMVFEQIKQKINEKVKKGDIKWNVEGEKIDSESVIKAVKDILELDEPFNRQDN